MSKTLLHRLFGFGRLPKKRAPELEREGIVLLDEGIGGSLRFRRFKAPGRYYGHKCSLFTGCLVLTKKRFVAFTFYPFFNPIIDVELSDPRLAQLDCSLHRKGELCVAFDPSIFNERWSGHIECRFSTPQASSYLERLKADSA